MVERQQLSARGPGDPIVIRSQAVLKFDPYGPKPILYCTVAEGSSLIYAVEVSEDRAEPRRWKVFDVGSEGLTRTTARALGLVAVAVRINVTAYRSGSITVDLRFEEQRSRRS